MASRVIDRPIMDRKALLADNLHPSQYVQACDCVEDDGVAFFDAAQKVGLWPLESSPVRQG